MEQGLDPRDFSLVAFGGAGPLHANALGKLLQAFPVIIPPSPGVLCAFGDATTCLRHEIAKTFVQNLGGSDPSEVVGAIEEMLESIQKIMIEEQGVDASKQVRPSIASPALHFRNFNPFPTNQRISYPKSCD